MKNDDRAVPPIPAPNTPAAKPRRDGSYQALTNGIPTANVVPAMPRKKPKIKSIAYEPRFPAKATNRTGAMEMKQRMANMTRPP